MLEWKIMVSMTRRAMMEEATMGRKGVREPVGAMIDDERSETLRLNHWCNF